MTKTQHACPSHHFLHYPHYAHPQSRRSPLPRTHHTPIRTSHTIARIRRTHETTSIKQCPHPPTPATGTCIGRWNGITDLCLRYAPFKAFVGTRGLTFRMSAQHVIRGHEGCGHGLHGR